MFADSMLEVSWGQRSRRGLSTLTSFGLQVVVLGTVTMLSLLKTVVMPTAQTVSTPITMGRPDPKPLTPRPPGGTSAPMSNNVAAIRFVQPGYIPRGVWQGKDEPSAEPSGPPGNFSDLNFPANRNALPISIISGTRPVMPVAPAPIVRPFRKSSMLEGMLIRRVQPAYPALARTARVQGPVVLDAIISKAGTMENLQVLSGHPMLVPAALEAVSQWRYRPYILNNEPIEVETRITVNFTLSGN